MGSNLGRDGIMDLMASNRLYLSIQDDLEQKAHLDIKQRVDWYLYKRIQSEIWSDFELEPIINCLEAGVDTNGFN